MSNFRYTPWVKITDLNTAQNLGDWVGRELTCQEPDTVHITRVITHEICRWFNNGLTEDDMAVVASQPADTGSPQWNALIEGVVAHHFHARGMQSPAWTGRTKLDVGWAPNDHLTPDLGWHILNVFSTPVELLDKGVIFARQNLVTL